MLVGNKLDMVDERQIDIATAQKAAEDYGLDYFETSAMTGDGVAEMMDSIMSKVYKDKLANAPKTEDGGFEEPKNGTVDLTKPRASMKGKPGDDSSESAGGCCG